MNNTIKNNTIENQYDTITGAVFVNLFSFSNDSGKILLDNFNTKDKTQLYLYEVAKSVCTIYNRPIILNMNFFKYILFKYKHKKDNISFNFKRLKNVVSNKEMLDFVAKSYQSESNIFIEIYDSYYNKEKTNV